jgi:hypothetical protein
VTEEIYYTYAWLREDKTPYYIGKGKKNRAWRKGSPPEERVLILKEGLCEEDAFKHEVYMIFVLGRKDKGRGILRNLTDGGEGCAGHHWEHTEEWRAKVRVSMLGKNKGKIHSVETRQKFSEAHKGKRHSADQRQKISNSLKGIKRGVRSEEHRRKLGEAHKGKSLSKEAREKIGKAHKGRVLGEEHRKKIGASNAKRKWFHNPESKEKKFCRPEDCPAGYLPGMKIKKIDKT